MYLKDLFRLLARRRPGQCLGIPVRKEEQFSDEGFRDAPEDHPGAVAWPRAGFRVVNALLACDAANA